MKYIEINLNNKDIVYNDIIKNRKINLGNLYELKYGYIIIYNSIKQNGDETHVCIKNMYFKKMKNSKYWSVTVKSKLIGEKCIIKLMSYDYDDKYYIKIDKKELITNRKIPNTKKIFFKENYEFKYVYEIIYTDLFELDEYYLVSIESIETKELKKEYDFNHKDVGKKCMLIKLDD